MYSSDNDLRNKTTKTANKMSENICIVANDPSLAFYRIQEHVRRVLPAIVEKRMDVQQLQDNLMGHCYDMEYAVTALHDIQNTEDTFKGILDLLRTSIYLKQQLNYEEANRTKKDTQSSVYKRFSAHLTLLDMPELPSFTGVMREANNRMEAMSAGNRASTGGGGGGGAVAAGAAPTTELQRSHTTLH